MSEPTRSDFDTDGRDVTPETVQREQSGSGSLTLFGTDDPSAVIEKARDAAEPLAGIIDERGLSVEIQGNTHVEIEGWTLLGSMLGVFPVVVWTQTVEDPDGWEARVEARTRSGEVIGAAEAQCDRSEPRWEDANDYEIRSMAQTRASSKALRMPLGFVMELGGYNPTPAEEVRDASSYDGTQGGESASEDKDPVDMTYPFGDHEGKPLGDVPSESLEWLVNEYMTEEKLNDDKYGDSNRRLKEAAESVLEDREDEEEDPGKIYPEEEEDGGPQKLDPDVAINLMGAIEQHEADDDELVTRICEREDVPGIHLLDKDTAREYIQKMKGN